MMRPPRCHAVFAAEPIFSQPFGGAGTANPCRGIALHALSEDLHATDKTTTGPIA